MDERRVCNICGGDTFTDMKGRPAVRCADCLSLERTRLLFFFLQELDLPPSARVLHMAPERGIHAYFRERLSAENYVCADFEPERYKFASDVRYIDLCDLDDWKSEDFDLIVHSHVLEYVQCTLARPLFHLHRMLRTTGRHVFVVPIRSGHYREMLAGSSDEERGAWFERADHARLFGRLDLDRHLGAIVRLPATFDAAERFGEARLRQANIPEKHWRGLHGSTVFELARGDYLLGTFA